MTTMSKSCAKIYINNQPRQLIYNLQQYAELIGRRCKQPISRRYGFCTNARNELGESVVDIIESVCILHGHTFEHYSNQPTFPISTSYAKGSNLYYADRDRMWGEETEHGQNRYDFCLWLAETLKKHHL